MKGPISTSLSQKLSGYSVNRAAGLTQGETQNIAEGFVHFSFYRAKYNESAKFPPAESPASMI